MPADTIHLDALIKLGLVQLVDSQPLLTDEGRHLQEKMKIQPRTFNRVKVTGEDAASMLDDMLSQLN